MTRKRGNKEKGQGTRIVGNKNQKLENEDNKYIKKEDK